MKKAELPLNEDCRLAALNELKLSHVSSDPCLDRIVRIAKQHYDTPVAWLGLIDKEQIWIKSCLGLEINDFPRDVSFCAHVALGDDIHYVADTAQDDEYADHPLVVGEPGIRCYIGTPIHSPDGHVIGVLAVIDKKPRAFLQAELNVLRDLAGCLEQMLKSKQATEGQSYLRSKQTEEELRRVKYTLDNTLDMIFMFHAETLLFVYLNKGAVASMGYSQEELLQMHPYDIKPQIPEPVFRQMIQPLLKGEKESLHFETAHRHKNGSDFPVEIFLQLVKDQQGSGRFVAIVRDITERKRVEQMKSEFVSTVSHELRTPLTSIRGALGLLLGGAAGSLSEQGKEMLVMADRNCDRLTLLINDLLDLEKIESGRLEFHFDQLDLIGIVLHAIEANENYARQRNVRLKFHQTLERAIVTGDENRLMQVFANLISNAVKFSPEDGLVELDVVATESGYRASVRDRGAGIPYEFRPRIFERFAQADSSDSREKGGTGLGLSISKVIIDRHGGNIDFATETGVGTTFYFELPAWSSVSSEQ